MVPDTLFARPNNRHNHVHHWSLETTNFQFVFKRFFSLLFHWLRCKVTSWWHVQPVVHVTTRLIWPELTRSTATAPCFKHKTDESCQTRQFRGSNIDCENHILWFAPHTCFFPLNIYMSDGYMSRQRDIIIATYRYFFAQEWKKPLNLPVERHTYEKKWPNCEILNMQILHGVWQSQMLPDLAVWRLSFRSRANKYRYIWRILKKNQNMRSELLDVQVLAFDVITSKLRCLNRCDERNFVEWVILL